MIEALDHINIRTHQVAEMIDWYSETLGFAVGPRPPFTNRGAWLYANQRPLVHLVETDAPPRAGSDDLNLEHGAFRANGFEAFIKRLESRGERFEIYKVPKFPVVQVNLWDPDGNHLHVDFNADEAPGVV